MPAWDCELGGVRTVGPPGAAWLWVSSCNARFPSGMLRMQPLSSANSLNVLVNVCRRPSGGRPQVSWPDGQL